MPVSMLSFRENAPIVFHAVRVTAYLCLRDGHTISMSGMERIAIHLPYHYGKGGGHLI